MGVTGSEDNGLPQKPPKKRHSGHIKKKKPGRLLIIDDERSVLIMLEKLFRNSGWEVHTAFNAEVAEDLVDLFEFDVVISDYRLPDANGVEFLNKLRKRKPWIKGLLLSGYSELFDRFSHKAEGSVYPFLKKPVKAKDLLAKAQALLKISRSISGL